MIKAVFGFVLFLSSVRCQVRKLEPFIVGGEMSDIKMFPHSVCLSVTTDELDYICGSSILNQRILLTAAHCISKVPPSVILIHYGHAHLPKTMQTNASAYKIHPNYVEEVPYSDIALVKTLNPLRFSANVQRVSILPMKDMPYDEMGFTAGWGMVDEIREFSTDHLHHIRQRILDRDVCLEYIMPIKLPEGIICAVGMNENQYASGGDSGSALIVRHYIQVGLVSYKESSFRSIVMFTDVGYFYKWIEENMIELFCPENNESIE